AGPTARTQVGLVLAWAGQGSLADVIRPGPVDRAAAWAMAHQLSGALAALHAAGVIHGDISPGNVLRADEGTWWLADLGDSRRVDAPPRERRRGTDGFRAPEVVDGAPADEAADVFALGGVVATALGMATDDPATPASDGDRTPVDSIDRVVRWAMSADPAERPSAAGLEQALASGGALDRPPPSRVPVGRIATRAGEVTRDFDLPPVPAPPPPPRRSGEPVRWRPGIAAISVGATALVALVLLAMVVAWPRPTPSPARAADRADETVEADREPCAGSSTEVPAGAVAVAGDPEGAGCTVDVLWWPDRAEAERPDPSGARRRFALGQPGDQLLLGDWDGDGRDTPALYSPSTGAVTRFDGWARAGEALPGSVVTTEAPAHGIARVDRRPDPDPDQVDVDAAPP
ncbi:MAG: protein kinase domain-containing protein, partial [Acidimicrobiales bacterium]